MPEPLLSVRDLNLGFRTRRGVVDVLRGVDIELAAGEVTALVGESGSGKSALGKSILQLHAPPFVPSGAAMTGSIRLAGEELLGASTRRLEQLRAQQVALISQEALSGLNPVMRIGRQIAEAARSARPQSGDDEADAMALEMIGAVGLPEPEARWRDYPHQLSGGQRQRVMIAMAAIRRPMLLIADEPTTALDVTVQARILKLLQKLQRDRAMAMLFITHDLGVVSEIAQNVAVMYAGRIVEQGRLAEVFTRPRHPYTAGLIGALPDAPPGYPRLAGQPPDTRSIGAGCAFAPRCSRRVDACALAPPQRLVGRNLCCCWNPLP